MEAVIRKAHISDAVQIGNVHYKAWLETYTGLLPEAYLAARSAEKSIALFRETACRNVVVAEVKGEIVGFCGWGGFREPDMDHKMGEIHGIYVLNSHKGKHLGQRLLAYALKQLETDGYDKAGLWVLDTNVNAIGFYEKMGFVHHGKTKQADLGQTVTEQLYTKTISREEK